MQALFDCARLMRKGPVQVQWSWMGTRLQVWFTPVSLGSEWPERCSLLHLGVCDTMCVHAWQVMNSFIFRILLIPGWDYFSHFNRELEHVFTHDWNDSVLVFYDFVYSGSATETSSMTYGFANGILSSHFGISVPPNGIINSGSRDSFCVGFANGISNALK